MAAGIYEFQQDVYHLLKQVDTLADVAVINKRPRDAAEAVLIEDAINKALLGGYLEGETGKAGLCIQVLMPDAEVNESNVPGPQLDVVLFVRITENPLVNEGADGTGIHAEDAAMIVLQALHHWHREGRCVYADKRAIRDGDTDEDGHITFEVVVRTELGVSPLARVADPVITYAAGNVTLASATSGAALYHTTDGSTPAPSNAAALLYAAPFAAASGVTIRAAAFKSGLLPSAIVRKTLSA